MFKFLPILLLLDSVLSFGSIGLSTKRCQETDERCLLKAINYYWQQLLDGEKSISTPLDPLVGDVAFTDPDVPGPSVSFYKPTITGLSHCKVTGFKLSLENRMETFLLFCPTLYLNGTYEVRGYGTGENNNAIKNLSLRVDTRFNLLTKFDGKTIMQRYRHRVQVMFGAPIMTDRHHTGDSYFDQLAKNKVAEFLLSYFIDILVNRHNRYLYEMAVDDFFTPPENNEKSMYRMH